MLPGQKENDKLIKKYLCHHDQDKNTPLHIAATNGRLEIVQLIIQNAVEKNPVNDFGNTPLHLAATHGHLEASRVILKNTSDCSPENNFGKTPLEFARKNGHDQRI